LYTQQSVTNQEKYGESGQFSRVPTPSLSAYPFALFIDNTAAEQTDEFIYVKNPPNCVGGIRVIIRASILVSRLLSSLRNTSIQFKLLVYSTIRTLIAWNKKRRSQAFFVVVCIGSIATNSSFSKAIMVTSLSFLSVFFLFVIA
jgi:hypothetical protein